MKKLIITTSLLTFLTGCGGSNSNPPAQTVNPTSPSTPANAINIIQQVNGFDFYGDETPMVGQNSGLGIHNPTAAKLVDIKWQQTSGANLDLIADHTNVIGFTPSAPGTYSFSVAARSCTTERDSSCGSLATTNISINVSNTESIEASVRMDHTAVEQGRVSLRVDPVGSKTIQSVQWVQVDGVDGVVASELEEQENRLFFDAPEVEQDTILKFTANVTFTDNTTFSDDVYLGVRNSEIDKDEGYFPQYSGNIVSENMFAFKPNSDYKDAIERCVYTNQINRSCDFAELPLIGMENMNPTVNDIMDRVLVSHDWMGERFEDYLTNSVVGPDMLRLLRGVTAIVISYEVRPSFYWAVTGAIYLDADNFWVTPLERDTLNEIPDYRSGFGSDLSFIMPWRYVKDNDYYPAGRFPVAERLTRTFADVEADISWLMYHELGHANDFFPPSSWSQLSVNRSPLETINLASMSPDSDALDSTFPLRSDEMHALAQVNFGGNDATNEQQDITPENVVNYFTPDLATGFYNYYTTREDYATLFEKFMMKYRLDADSDIAIVARDNNPEYLVTWGQRNRFNAPALQERVLFTVNRVLPEIDARLIQMSLPAPQSMRDNISWFDNLNLSSAAKNTVQNNQTSFWQNDTLKAQQIKQDIRNPHLHKAHSLKQ
ncbi:MAG: Uncharacterised protein [Glaciecola sp. HTCC2999]|jgi:hypothetical protein|nr:MAG: Uncharacterised protein [Glaciecola sp. HTCC2999]